MDIQSWRGSQVTLVVDKLAEDSKALDQIEVSDYAGDSSDVYREALRPQFHFPPCEDGTTIQTGWSISRRVPFVLSAYPYGWGWGKHALGTRCQSRPWFVGRTRR